MSQMSTDEMNLNDEENNDPPAEENPMTVSPLYDKVIYPNRYFLGLWKADIKTYGGLLLVKCVSGGVEGWELRPPTIKNFLCPLRVRPLFRICLPENDNDPKVTCFCLGLPVEKHESHEANIQMTSPDDFEFQCSNPETHLKASRKNPHFHAWLDEERGYTEEEKESVPQAMRYDDGTLKKKFLGIRNYRFHYQFRRLDLTVWDKEFGFGRKPVQSGLFKGTSSDSGVEIIQLSYEVNSKGDPEAKALKITGDPFVQAKKITFKAKLNMPLTFACKDEQNTKEKLEAIEVEKRPYRGHSGEPKAQPFILPNSCSVDYSFKLPRFCKYRFIGWGQTAEEGFENPQLIKGHWVVFNEDLFGFIFLSEEHSMSLFHRVKNLDPDTPLPSSYEGVTV